ncbi:MAG TPA: hypothetical protein DC023_05035, partial [Oceanospirillaceae bacterium]|nr:hypothetical protein [Oceanospirillaceae bacterium]
PPLPRPHHTLPPPPPFSPFDPPPLAGLAFAKTVWPKVSQAAAIAFDNREAHSALYDAEKTAELFCYIVNRWRELGGWQAEEDFPFGM